MVILFGSHARGDWVQDPVNAYFSDYDVLVVVEEPGTVERHELWFRIEERAERLLQPAALSLIVHDIENIVEERREYAQQCFARWYGPVGCGS